MSIFRSLGAPPPMLAPSAITPIETVALALALGATTGVTFDPATGVLEGKGNNIFKVTLKAMSLDALAAASLAMQSIAAPTTSFTPDVDTKGVIVQQATIDAAKAMATSAITAYAAAVPFSIKTLAYRAAAFLAFEQVSAVAMDKNVPWLTAFSMLTSKQMPVAEVWPFLLVPETVVMLDDQAGPKISMNETFLAYITAASQIRSSVAANPNAPSSAALSLFATTTFIGPQEMARVADLKGLQMAPPWGQFNFQSGVTLYQNTEVENSVFNNSLAVVGEEVAYLLGMMNKATEALYADQDQKAKCEADPANHWNGTACVTCGPNELWSATQLNCLKKSGYCGPGTHWNVPTQSCMSDAIIAPFDEATCAAEKAGYHWSASLKDCVKCTAGNHWDAQKLECVPDIVSNAPPSTDTVAPEGATFGQKLFAVSIAAVAVGLVVATLSQKPSKGKKK